MCNVIVNLLLKVLCFYSWVKVTNLILLKSNQQGEYSKKDRNKIFSFQKLVVTRVGKWSHARLDLKLISQDLQDSKISKNQAFLKILEKEMPFQLQETLLQSIEIV